MIPRRISKKIRIRKIRNITVMTIVGLGFVAMIYFSTRKDSLEKRIDKNAGEIKGFIFQTEEKESITHTVGGSHVSKSYILSVRYQVNGNTYQVIRTLGYKPRQDSILVRYDLDDPGRSYIVPE